MNSQRESGDYYTIYTAKACWGRFVQPVLLLFLYYLKANFVVSTFKVYWSDFREVYFYFILVKDSWVTFTFIRVFRLSTFNEWVC